MKYLPNSPHNDSYKLESNLMLNEVLDWIALAWVKGVERMGYLNLYILVD